MTSETPADDLHDSTADVHLRALRHFVTVAEEGNFTRAATERLSISQPALSKQIRALERHIHADLFTRGARSVTLTPAGAALLPWAKRLLAEWQGALDEVATATAAQSMTLTVGMHSRVGPRLIAGVEAQMNDQTPGWGVRFRQVPWDDPAVGLIGELVDAALAWLPIRNGRGICARVVATEERWVALPAGHRLADEPSVRFADIADEPFIALPDSAGPMQAFWLAMDQRTTAPVIAMQAHTAEETFAAVAAGVGVVLVSATNAAVYQSPGVVCRPVTDLPPSELVVLWRAADHRQALRVLVEACERHGAL